MSVAVAGAIVWLSTAPAAAGSEPPAAVAASEPPEVQDARDAYRLGISLVKQGQWSDALAAFERSFRLKPDAVTAFDIGYCERALGRLTRAKKSFVGALGAPELPADKAAEARGYLAEIESRLARAVIARWPAGASMAVDGRPLEAPAVVGAAAAGAAELVAGTREPGPPETVSAPSFTLVLDPGTHVFVVGAPGLPDAVVARQLAPGVITTLTLATLAEKPAPVGPARHIGAVIAFGASGVSALAGTVFGALALKNKGYLDGVCPQKDQCASGTQGTIDATNTFATVATVGLSAAVAGAAVGTLLLLTDQQPAPRVAMALGRTPGFSVSAAAFVGPQGAGVQWLGCF